MRKTAGIVEHPRSPNPRDPAIRVVAHHVSGYWYAAHDEDYEDGPIPVDFAEYRVVRKIDLWEY